jgi:predicted phosphodiesterase
MRVAALYDIHGNLPALEAVLAEIARVGVDRIVVGGDLVPGPLFAECLQRLRHLSVPVDFIHGNGESAVLALRRGGSVEALPEQARASVRWVADQLQPDVEQMLAQWPSTHRLTIAPLGEVLFCHATPRNDTEIFTVRTPEDRLLPVFDGVNAALVVCGHTHMQFDRRIGSVRVVNAGSVGMPFGERGANWLLLGPDVDLRYTRYDFDAAADRIRDSDYPDALEFVDRSILQPPSEEEMLTAYGRVSL